MAPRATPKQLSAEAFANAFAALSLQPSDALHAELIARYSAPARHYHNTLHLSECLALLADHAADCESAPTVAVALWFHDAIYDPQRHDNEAQSADYAERCVHARGAPDTLVAKLRNMIMATAGHAPSSDRDTTLLVDIDLAILGAEDQRFDQYEAGIRAEFCHVDDATYCRHRARFLASMLDRQPLFASTAIAATHTRRARANLQRLLASLV